MYVAGMTAAPAAMQADRVEIPERSQAIWVAEEINQNGMPMQIQQFRSELGVEEVLNFYRDLWRKRRDRREIPGYIENSIDGWSVISRYENDTNIVVQLKASAEGTGGYISTTRPMEVGGMDAFAISFPRLGGTDLVSNTASRDGGRTANTLILMNRHTVESNVLFYQSSMPGLGWKAVRDSLVEGVGVLMFNRDGETCEMSISRGDDDATVILANVVVQ